MRRRNKILLACAGAVVAIAAAVPVIMIGPSNLIGMALYDQRDEGTLVVGQRSPDVELLSLDGKLETKKLSEGTGKPMILIFGSFT